MERPGNAEARTKFHRESLVFHTPPTGASRVQIGQSDNRCSVVPDPVLRYHERRP